MTQTLESATGQDHFIAISVSTLVPATICEVALYMRDGPESSPRLFRSPNLPIVTEQLQRLEEAGCRKLYISSGDHQAFQQYLRKNLGDVLGNEGIQVTHRFRALNDVVRDVLGETFGKKNVDHTVAQVQELGHHMVGLICREDSVASELCGVLYHDYQTFTHSANVAYYCVMLAKELGIKSQDELTAMAAGAMLHDLGKLDIPDAILTKPGKLTDSERDVIQQHPTGGLRKLGKRSDLSYAQLMMVYQHHERLDGTGYPVRIGSNEIHPWAKICAVVDIFEALTSNRPYRAGMSTKVALDILERQAGQGLDEEYYKAWKSLIQRQ